MHPWACIAHSVCGSTLPVGDHSKIFLGNFPHGPSLSCLTPHATTTPTVHISPQPLSRSRFWAHSEHLPHDSIRISHMHGVEGYDSRTAHTQGQGHSSWEIHGSQPERDTWNGGVDADVVGSALDARLSAMEVRLFVPCVSDQRLAGTPWLSCTG